MRRPFKQRSKNSLLNSKGKRTCSRVVLIKLRKIKKLNRTSLILELLSLKLK